MSKPDAIEQLLPDVDSAASLLSRRDPEFVRHTKALADSWCADFPDDAETFNRMLPALWLAYARMALRHGTWSDDFHAYHNESHTRDILVDRISIVQRVARPKELAGESVALLALFAVTHDLRQRESGPTSEWVGPNERASVDEAHRIMVSAGFDANTNRSLFETLKLMIEGSTFVSDPGENAGGATAVSIVRHAPATDLLPDWEQLVLLAADVDTANVSEPFFQFARGSAQLFEELEMRKGRKDLSTDSAEPALEFLTVQQKRYFFEHQQFSSRLGQRAFADAKAANAPRLTRAVSLLTDQFNSPDSQLTGRQVLDGFLALAAELAEGSRS